MADFRKSNTQNSKPKILYLIAPRGWCAGVERAIAILDRALELFAPPVYVRREIVHNKAVVDAYAKKGVVFVHEIGDIPAGQTVIFSAHGVAPDVRVEARRRQLHIIDATCPLVTKVHGEVLRFVKNGYSVFYIGHKNHEEAVGVIGEAPGEIHVIQTERDVPKAPQPKGKSVVLTQTTLSVDDTRKIVEALRERFPAIETPRREDICYATSNRQGAVKLLIARYKPQLIYVIGSKNSSNSNRLCEVAQSLGVKARLIDNVADVRHSHWETKTSIGLTAGASAPESLVQEVVNFFKDNAYRTHQVTFEHEHVNFAIPNELTQRTLPCRK